MQVYIQHTRNKGRGNYVFRRDILIIYGFGSKNHLEKLSCAVICSLRFFLSPQRQHFIKQSLTRLKAQLPWLRQYRRFKVYQFYFQFYWLWNCLVKAGFHLLPDWIKRAVFIMVVRSIYSSRTVPILWAIFFFYGAAATGRCFLGFSLYSMRKKEKN